MTTATEIKALLTEENITKECVKYTQRRIKDLQEENAEQLEYQSEYIDDEDYDEGDDPCQDEIDYNNVLIEAFEDLEQCVEGKLYKVFDKIEEHIYPQFKEDKKYNSEELMKSMIESLLGHIARNYLCKSYRDTLDSLCEEPKMKELDISEYEIEE